MKLILGCAAVAAAATLMAPGVALASAPATFSPNPVAAGAQVLASWDCSPGTSTMAIQTGGVIPGMEAFAPGGPTHVNQPFTVSPTATPGAHAITIQCATDGRVTETLTSVLTISVVTTPTSVVTTPTPSGPAKTGGGGATSGSSTAFGVAALVAAAGFAGMLLARRRRAS